MKVALVHDFLTQYGGAEKVLEVLHEVWPDAPVYTLFYDKNGFGDKFKGWDIRVSPIQNLPFGVSHYRWYLGLMPMAIERFDLRGYDLVISAASGCAKGILTHKNTKHFSYCYSPTRYLWSDAYDYLNGLRSGEKIFRKLLPPLLTYLRNWDYLAAQRADKIIAISDFIKKRIKKYYHREADAIIYPPVEVNQFYISPEIGDYYLLVSRLRPYKKIDLAIQAFNKLKIPLKIIGTGQDASLKKIAGPFIEFLGSVDEETKAKYLSHCKALIFPQEEDFGIVPVEAMASGRPVIAYRAGGALEIVEEGKTGMFSNEQTWENLAETVIKFNPENFDPKYIRSQAEKFSKERFKKELLLFLRENAPNLFEK
ncbi:MAG: glycosyltransferase [Patescibacteria group bacterium]|nr:glycosyltransferase [Patescibacteria group bacterium]MDD5121228.1 glycosyltransferase [Patescibacteria group bacterium]MDD5222249.1 glycosyltransferase [Patescibacteria group bacterium]MDD5395853.1 glycosyltransferase [Patescibacteria group bacterium]